ncbi:hypothetical protein [Candidatus Methylomicrobium oryzae]|uniref:hypothetical protein n=1 Tax=Candidatus Methylomicrobium oryzae TaxID=2802053 RepID=UPI001921CA1D|nr:hypothetical protein [Methylomicrobium sp. RS1]MBL1264706.1 hypothetical protein [Methylomicrobium sp. RS1]
MKNILNMSLLTVLLFAAGSADVYADQYHSKSCSAFQGKLTNLKLHESPKRVLLIPLLSRDPSTNETPRWPEQPARVLKTFYKSRFNSEVQILHDIWNWSDYYPQVERLALESPPFDRIIFISHGGFDGPVMKNAVFRQKYRINEGKGELVQLSEAQPGLLNRMEITYGLTKNPAFSDYIASNLDNFKSMKSSDIFQQLKNLEMRLQPLDQSCFERYCGPDKLANSPARLKPYRLDICARTCREPLFEQKNTAEIASERFFTFTKSLRSLLAEDGLIFFGTCNPGSAAPKKEDEPDTTELLINSDLAGGPHQTYVHLVSAATGRIAAGPIGKSSAEDIVNRVMLFENNRPQQRLCIALPPGNYRPYPESTGASE